MSDATVIDNNSPGGVSTPPPPKGSGGWLAWILALLLAVGAGAGYVFVLSPLEQRLAETEADLATVTGERDKLLADAAKLANDAAKLLDKNAELAAEKALAEQALEAMRRTQDELESRLQEEVKKGNVLIKQQHGELVVDLLDKVVFDSGEAELNDKGKEVLRQVGETLLKVPDKIIFVAGHTDNLPISDKLLETFPTNWELSTARATQVVRFLQEEVKVPGERLAVGGHGEFRPIGSNRSKGGRRRNRRIEVRLLPLQGAPK